jgi:hypothetical protein
MTRKPYSKYYPGSSSKKVETTNETVNESEDKTATKKSKKMTANNSKTIALGYSPYADSIITTINVKETKPPKVIRTANSNYRVIDAKDLLKVFNITKIEDLSTAMDAKRKSDEEIAKAQKAERAKKIAERKVEKKALDEKKAQEKIKKAINKAAAGILKSTNKR